MYNIYFLNFIYLFYLWPCWVFVSVRGLSPVAASGGRSSSRCAGLSLSRRTGSRRAGSVVVAHGPSCSVACGIFPDQGWNPRPLHWQADSQPLRRQGSPSVQYLIDGRQLGVFLICLLLCSLLCWTMVLFQPSVGHVLLSFLLASFGFRWQMAFVFHT